MKNDDFVKKLEILDVPDVQVESHRQKLREALLATAAVKGLAKEETLRDKIDARLNKLSIIWQRPIWKLATLGLTAVLIALSVLLGINITGTDSPVVLASNIALNSPEVPSLLEGNGEIKVINVNVTGFTARVICGRDVSNIVQADVDLRTRKVTKTQRFNGLFVPELAESQQADAINIARNDPRVKQMMSQGAHVRKVMPSLSSISGVSKIDDNTLKLLPGSGAAVIQMEFNGRSWLIQTNLNDHVVERIIEPQLWTPSPPGYGGRRRS